MISMIENASWTVVVSRGQSRNPEKRALEQAIIDATEKLEGVNVLSIPHLYDLPKTSEAYQKLADLDGSLILCSWIFPRAAHWVLDRNGIQGQVGEVLLGDEQEEPTDVSGVDLVSSDGEDGDIVDRVSQLHPRRQRDIHCIDFKVAGDTSSLVSEIRRIVGDDLLENDRSLPIVGGKIVQVEEQASRRWYPVIDFNRCTNCMECVDFCLFGVYGVDGVENILVEQPDNCRKGCPACSRVCPENAIIFPQHKAPAIAGAETEGSEGFKIDLSELFGAPKNGDDPIELAARERDEQLLLAGRDTVGINDVLRKRQSDRVKQPKDPLDRLIDSLDEFDL